LAKQQTQASTAPALRGTGDEQEIDLIDYLLVIWRHRWMILLLTLVAMAVTVVLMLRTPRRYQASATIVPPVEILQKEAGSGLGALGNSMLRNIMDSGSIAGIYVEILESREVADSIIDQFDLMHAYEKIDYRSDARKELDRNTRIESTEDGAVKIAVTDLDPNRAAAMANAYIAELDQRNKRLSTGQATSKRIFLENRLKEVEDRLMQIDTMLSREAKIQEMLYELLVQQYEMAKIEEAKSMPTIQVLDEAVVPELPVARGTVRKGIMAGMAAMMLGVFLAFAREYAASARLRQRPAASSPPQA
jgi:uncharacterized protein involved in exopolysaccharide biosynthesis